MQILSLGNTPVGPEVIILVATIAVCVVVAYLLSLGEGRHFGH